VSFAAPLFADGMILQRDTAGTKVWGTSLLHTTGVVTVFVLDDDGSTILSKATAHVDAAGKWAAALGAAVPARNSTSVVASVVSSTAGAGAPSGRAALHGVAWGDVLVCGGQSNMAFAMCSAVQNASFGRPGQTAVEALESVSFATNPLRVFQEAGGPGAHLEAKGNACLDNNKQYMHTPVHTWFNVSLNSSGGFSAVCLLTAQRLRAHLGGGVPVGAVQSCT